MKIPKFLLYGQGDSRVETNIQPSLAMRQWGSLSDAEKRVALQELKNRGWVDSHSEEILKTIEYLNYVFLRQCPGKNLHAIRPESSNSYNSIHSSNESAREAAAELDFQQIFLREGSDAMVFRMLSKLASCHIYNSDYQLAAKSKDEKERKQLIDRAFEKFDRFAYCLNHIFEQFAVNQLVTRNGFVPRQDEKITNNIYVPTLHILADPKWVSVNDNLAKMFEDYRDENYSEAITKAHSAVQRFFQVLVGDEGKNGKGEIGKLFQKAKEEGVIPTNRFTEQLITAIKGFILSERATNSTAKPALKDATSSDALLMMNVVMVFLQHCLHGR